MSTPKELQIKQIIEDFKQEMGITEDHKNMVYFMHLFDNIAQFSLEEDLSFTSSCHCDCRACEDCDYA